MAILALLMMLAGAQTDRAAAITGTVIDASGAPVAAANVVLEMDGGRTASASTGPDGRFNIPVTGATGDVLIVRVSAPGFAEASSRFTRGNAAVRIILQPRPLSESVTVTASRGAAGLSSPASTSVVTSAELLNSAAGGIDDALRNTPGFSLFRRSSSRVANPTIQGVTLRGVSGSGASRTIVLADGFPLNDAFGSWVYWNRIPQTAVDVVEVVRGASGDLYGADALGGVIQVLTFDPGRRRLRAAVDGGSHDTARASTFVGGSVRGWSLSAAGELLNTDGAVVLSDADRGTVDVKADSDYRSGLASVGYAGSGGWRAVARGSVFTEDRGNGTVLQVNDTNWRQMSGEVAGSTSAGVWQIRGAGGTQTYFQTFSAVAAGRATERLTNDQRIPIDFGNVSAQWVSTLGRHTLLGGVEARRTTSAMTERRYTTTGALQSTTVTSGDETIASLFSRLRLDLTDDVTVVVGGRGDRWKSAETMWFFSPRVSLGWRLTPAASLQVAASRVYRTPTLNELYRGFSVGAVVTNANPALEPERLTSVEGGVLLGRGRASGRVTAFWNTLDGAIANITIGTNRRQRQNADQVRAVGVEMEADLRPVPSLTVTLFSALTSSYFHDTPKQPALDGNRIPQVPRYQVGAGVTWLAPRIATVMAQARFTGAQFEDDLNTLTLRRYSIVDLSATRAITRGVHGFVGVENLFDVEYDTGRTPLRTIGWPRTVRAGFRVFLP